MCADRHLQTTVEVRLDWSVEFIGLYWCLLVYAMVYGELLQKFLRCLVFVLGHYAFDEFHNALEFITACLMLSS